MSLKKMANNRYLAYLLVVAMLVSVLPLGGIDVLAQSGAGTLVTEKSAVVVTGTGLVGDGYTQDNISREKSYTLEELKALAGDNNYWVYSALNSVGNTNYYNAKGVPVSTLLEKSNFTEFGAEKISVYATDNYGVHFDPTGPDLNGKYVDGELVSDENGNGTGGSFGLTRYFFANKTDTEGIEVPTILAWQQGGSKGTGDIPKESDLDEMSDLQLMTGQVATVDMNNPLFNGKEGISANQIVVKSKITEKPITIDGAAKTRSEILLMPRAEKSYTYSTKGGNKTDYVRGVPLAVLLADYQDSDVISFTAADNYKVDASGKTKAELVAGNYILAYEKGSNRDDLEGIYGTAKDNAAIIGYFTLYGDGATPGQLISKISVTSASGIDFSKSPYKHITNGGLPAGYDGPYDIDGITGATLTIEGPGVEKSIPLSIRELEEQNAGAHRGEYSDLREGVNTKLKYEGIRLSYVLNNMTLGDNGIKLTSGAYKVLIKNRVRKTIAEFTLEQVAEAENKGKPIIIAYGTAKLDDSDIRPFVYDDGTGGTAALGNEDGCIKLVYDKNVITDDQNTDYTKFGNMAYIYVAEESAPGYKHENPPYNTPENSQYVLTITGDKIGREVNYTVAELEKMVKYDPATNAPETDGIGYRAEYSLANSNYWYVNEYEGLKLWDLLLKSGLPATSANDENKNTFVEFSATDGYKDFDKFTLEQISNPDLFGYYEKGSEDLDDGKYVPEEDDLLDIGFPVLVAYGVNSYPYVIKSSLDGYMSGLSNDGGPLRIISGKQEYHHANGSKQAKLLDKVIVGEDKYYSTHKYNPKKIDGAAVYQDLAENTIINVKVISGQDADGTILKEVNYKLGDLEEILYGGTLNRNQLNRAKAKEFYEIQKDSSFCNDLYEGVNLEYFLTDEVKLPGYKGFITFSDGKKELKRDLNQVIGFTGANSETELAGISPVLAFAKNGAPMVKDKNTSGYEGNVTLAAGTEYEQSVTVKNDGGPLAVIFPREAMDSPTADSLTNVTSITINLVPDKYAHTEEPYNTLAGDKITVSGEGTRLTKPLELTVAELEGKQTLAVTGDYNIKGEKGDKQLRYRGIPLYELLNSPEIGLKPNAHQVKITCNDDTSYTFDLAEIIKKDYINGQNPSIKNLRMILAYGSASVNNDNMEDGLPLVVKKDDPGYNADYDNAGGPIRLVVGQINANDVNSSKVLKQVVDIEVTASEMTSWNHSTSPVYEQYLDSPFIFQVIDQENKLVLDKTYTLGELEAMTSLVERESITWVGTDEREGINLWRFVLQEAGHIPGINDPSAVTAFAADGFSKELRSIFGMEGLTKGVKDGTKYVPILLSYAVDGHPLVPDNNSAGYTALIDNGYGPIRLMTHNNQGACLKHTTRLVVKLGAGGGEPTPTEKDFHIYGLASGTVAMDIKAIKNISAGQGGKVGTSYTWFDKTAGQVNTDQVKGAYLVDLLAEAGVTDAQAKVTINTTDNYLHDSYKEISLEEINTNKYFVAFDLEVDGKWQAFNDTDKNGKKATIRIYRNHDDGQDSWFNRVTNVQGVTVTIPDTPSYTFDTYMGDGKSGNLPLSGVRSIWVDDNDGLWVSTYGGGVAHRAKGADTFTVYNKASEPALETAVVSAIAVDKDGGVWMTQNASYTEPGNNQGIAYMKDGKITYYKETDEPQTIPNNYAQEIQIDKEGNIWFGSFGGLTKYDPKNKTWTTWDQKDGFPAMSVDNLILDNKGGVWCGFYPNGDGSEDDLFVGGYAYMDKDGKITTYEYTGEYDADLGSSLLADVWVRDIALDAKGGAWVTRSGSYGDLENVGGRVDYVASNGQVTRFTGKDLLGEKLAGNNEIRMVAIDPVGGIWFGTSGSGVFHFKNLDAEPVQYNSTNNAWPDEGALNNVYSLDFVGNTLYVGTAGGLSYKEFTFTEKPSGGSGGGGGSGSVTSGYTVQFNTNGGSSVGSIEVKADGKLTKPANPTKAGYVFEGWYLDQALTKSYDFASDIKGNITLYAKWITGAVDGFSDTKGHWAEEFIGEMTDLGILKGRDAKTFAPNAVITRAEFATILARMSGDNLENLGTDQFKDIGISDWYATEVAWAVKSGVTEGITADEFAPYKEISREQMATMIIRYVNYKKFSMPENHEKTIFIDQEKISAYAIDGVEVMQKAGIISGRTDRSFDPQGQATRAEAAKMLCLLLRMM